MELRAEELEHVRIELLVESDPVEAWRVLAELGHCLYRGAANQEGEVPCVPHYVILVLLR